MHNHNSLAAAALLSGLMFVSVPAFGQGYSLPIKSSVIIGPGPLTYQQVSAPVFMAWPGNFFWSDIEITITCATSGVSIRYTTDGSTPTPTYGTLYSGPVILHLPAYQIVELRAIAYTQYVNYTPSVVTDGLYTYYPPVLY
ncbi:MAG TPA: chitobiase/beta-hexosaminidase C-terminal domain-containing protein [Opitutaceae bacterium]|nr:chitobiase/beta-hexosaminidase C-terminal domain-containing protein [Opitutaceae bacterium]